MTQKLSERFSYNGHQVGIFTLNVEPRGMEKRYPNYVVQFEGGGKWLNLKCLMNMRYVLKIERPDIIINNWGLRPLPILMFKLAQLGLPQKPKIISIYHNDPTTNGVLQRLSRIKKSSNCKIKGNVIDLASKLIVFLSAIKFKTTYKYSDMFILLSQSFIKPFQAFAGIKNSRKIRVIPNAITIDKGEFEYDGRKKRNEIIYVGRLDEDQKRVSRVIDIWSRLERNHPEWQLKIVGDGPARKDLEKLVDTYSLKKVSFEGYQMPKSYYENASILILTSEFEGFGLVIVEGMQFGVVPVVYGSYPAVYDIITDGEDGYILPYHKEGFNLDEAVSVMEKLMASDNNLNITAIKAMKNSERFSMDMISKEWYNLFEEII